jgi:prevent-host-death family protein
VDVGVRELKAKLSEYLGKVKAGEVITVTDRGRPIARIGPLSAEERIQQGIEEGWIRPGNGMPPERIKRRFKVDTSIQEMLDEDRGT